MIKIEKIKGLTGFIKRNEKQVTLYVGLLITHDELETIDVSGEGVLQYSIDELEVVTKEFKKPEPVKQPESVKQPEPVKTTKSGKVIL